MRGIEGKVAVDATNHFQGERPDFPSLAHLVKSITGGPVAKAFNLNFAAIYDQISSQQARPSCLYCADEEAREVAEQLISDAGYEPANAGGLDNARALEDTLATLFAVYQTGGSPVFYRFGKPGASHEAIFHNAMQWAEQKIVFLRPRLIVWEAPLAGFKGGRTTNDVTTILFGLPAVIGAVAYKLGVYDVRKADTRDVRHHFIGCNPKRAKAKPLVVAQCRAMGWPVEDDNEADALATWSYQCSILDPRLALKPTALFGRSAQQHA